MSIKLYNSLKKRKEELVPLEKGKIKMYSCGVTVYDKCHIGHARSLYVVEMLRCYLRYRGYEVLFVRNITDVDDKIIKKAADTGRRFEDVVQENIDCYYGDLESLGIPPADKEPRATEKKNIDAMIKHIQGLIDKGFAYAADGDVYFRVREFKEYGKLSGQSVDQMRDAVRIDKDEKKQDPLDFALWKSSKPGEPSWLSPWGEGRPGWHIECSAMSMKHLGTETLDIHAGGRDLIFPHHENEVAQSEALTGKPFARHWIHNGLLTINGQKMAKSLGNFITIEDMLKQHFAEDVKMFLLMTHYSSAIDFSEEKMFEAHKAANKIRRIISAARELAASQEPEDSQWLDSFRSQFEQAMDNDLNTPMALGVIYTLISEINRAKNSDDHDRYLRTGAAFIESLMTEVFGFKDFYDADKAFQDVKQQEEIKTLLAERAVSRQAKDFKRSDQLRDLLKEKGVVVEDTKDGQKWRLV